MTTRSPLRASAVSWLTPYLSWLLPALLPSMLRTMHGKDRLIEDSVLNQACDGNSLARNIMLQALLCYNVQMQAAGGQQGGLQKGRLAHIRKAPPVAHVCASP